MDQGQPIPVPEYYEIGSTGNKYYRSADGRTWYIETPDGRKKCPPNITLMLEKQRAIIHEEREKEELEALRQRHLASPTGSEQPAASSAEVKPSPASNDEP